MNTMQSFYMSLSSNKLQNAYLKILSGLTKINREKIKVLMSELGWQEW